ncbi:MAG TPA: 23S rRNA (guanosine(2251)-2'-O)-methyltransferase RlmB [Mycobacteriales bacterium]|jgi:23S rRNA (guanosine2251-2'-O)-methyltransferase|nr:23S rRNA (guanosine(2251)-2'-O)-methyltransferase RlmB [Mycobacteriales bacterium]
MAANEGRGGPRRGSAKGLPKKSSPRGKDGRSALSGSGGYNRKRLEGKGPTPKASERTGHPAARRAAAASRHDEGRAHGRVPGREPRRGAAGGDTEHVAGRNPVVEALRAQVPATALLVATGMDRDPRVTEAVKLASAQGVPLLEAAKPELDRLTDRAQHQGLVLRVPAYSYAHPADLLAVAEQDGTPALLVALDGVTDPRNLGAVVRSTAAFGGHGVLLPARRAAGMTASAWKASAGAAARVRVAQATNLTRALKEYATAGLLVLGLAADGELSLDDLVAATDPLVLVVGSEGKGMSRLVAEACDLRVSIPLASHVESLNASVAAGIALAEVARRRRDAGRL